MESIRVFDENFHTVLNDKIKSILEDNEETTIENKKWSPENLSLCCSYCRTEFVDNIQQREHYKLDWHRYNLKQSLLKKEPITEEEFNGKTEQDEISSISGSDTDEKEEYATAQSRIYLQNEKGIVFSIYYCLLFDRKENINVDLFQKNLINCCKQNKKWTILMLGGGHFAGAVFNGENLILHKTFHCYTVRAGQGGSQSSRDNKSSGSHPKSAGASLRRYNEQALVQHVRGILEKWSNEINDSSLIFYRASGPYNRAVLFSGNTPILDKNDIRLRTIPFSTRRATFTEVKRVHSLLITAKIYDDKDKAFKRFTQEKQPEIKKKININRSKSPENVERSISIPIADTNNDSSYSSDEEVEIIAQDDEVSFKHLKEFDDSLKPHQRKKKSKRKSKTKKLKEIKEAEKANIMDVIIKGDNEKLINLLENGLEIDKILDNDGNTLLHIAAINENGKIIKLLLDKNANPCIKNDKQQTPYTCTSNKEIREILKQFARDNPDKFNYNKAQIPVNLATPEELAEKRKAQRKIKKEKEKIKKQENLIKQKEQEERERFLKLSDREKRALAAERRILSKNGDTILRCFYCADDITGKVPFEYLGNRFCSVDCLKKHRITNPEHVPEI